MSEEEFDNFKLEIKEEISSQVINSFRWIKWSLALVIGLFSLFAGTNIYLITEIAQIKENYVTRTELQEETSKLKLEISLPLQLINTRMNQVKAIVVDKNIKSYEKYKQDEELIMNEILALRKSNILTRGGK